MGFGLQFVFGNILFGVGLAMDAFSVSLANGLHEPAMKKRRAAGIALVFAFFQGLMPMLGWVCVHTAVRAFAWFAPAIPWIALVLLCYIGGHMLYDGIKNENADCACVTCGGLLLQGIATSIDALSVGFTIAEYSAIEALCSALIIAAVTFVICAIGISLGKRIGTRIAGKASILGGLILIFIGIQIFVSNFIG